MLGVGRGHSFYVTNTAIFRYGIVLFCALFTFIINLPNAKSMTIRDIFYFLGPSYIVDTIHLVLCIGCVPISDRFVLQTQVYFSGLQLVLTYFN